MFPIDTNCLIFQGDRFQQGHFQPADQFARLLSTRPQHYPHRFARPHQGGGGRPAPGH